MSDVIQILIDASEARLDWLLRECKIVHYIPNEADEMASDYPVEHYASVGKLMIDRDYIDAELDKLKGVQ